MTRWLAIYVDKNGKSRSAMITPTVEADFPFGVDEFELGLDDFDGEPVTLIEMPDDPHFRPEVVDVSEDVALPMQFVDLIDL
jgi:hypothetical protein